MSNTFFTFTSNRGNVLKTKDVKAALNTFITPDAKPGQSYVDSVLLAPPQRRNSGKYKKVKPQTFYIKAQKGGK